MAFTKAPSQSTYQTKPIMLMKEYDSRAAGFAKDVDYLNVFFEITKNKTTQENMFDIWPRPGTADFSSALQSTNVRQVYYWEAQQQYYVWVDDDLQIINSSGTITTTLTSVLGTSTGTVGVTEFLYDDGSVKLVFTDGTSLKTIDTANTIVACADADLPTPLATSMVFLDGYLFVLKSGTADIYNSDLNDPLTWTPGDFITAEMLPDSLITISRLNNYLVAFGSSSVEYFWDAANVAGSPLQRNDTPVKLNGYLGGLAQYGNRLFYLGNNTEGTPNLFVLEDFKIKELGNESLRRQLELTSTATSYATWNAVVSSVNGHAFYIITAGDSYTYSIDIETSLWSRWAHAANTNFPISFSANSKTSAAYIPVVYLVGGTVLRKFTTTTTTDAGTSYSYQIVTGLEDFDSYNHKTINRLTVYGDRPTADTTMTITWTDDDYQTYNTGQTVNLNQELPCIYQCGGFRRRAHKLTCSPTVPFRIRYLEADINLGNS
jgi:hypothetical protein